MALIERGCRQVDVTYRFSGFRADPVRRLLFGPDGEPIALKPRVFDTLLYLVEHRGELLQKQTLLDAIWPHVIVEENNLNQAISTLRRVLGETRDDHRFIVTEPGRGYRFVAPVEAVPVESATSMRVYPSSAEAAPPAARLEASAPRSHPPPTTARPRKRLLVVSATALVLAGVVAASGWIGQRAAAARWVDPTNFVPRITLPVLMLNGKYDWFMTVEDAQKPLYELLGTRPEDKRYYALEAGHSPLPRAEVVRLVLDWLDRYLGPVE